MQFIDRRLAARLESVERIGQIRYAEGLKLAKPQIEVAIEEIAGGHMVFTGPQSPIGRAIGLGLDGPVSAADMERVETFYFSRGADAQIDVVPAADESLFAELKQRPYRLLELNNVMALEFDLSRRFHTQIEGIEIRRAGPEESLVCAEVLGRCFGGFSPEIAEAVAAMFAAPALTFLAMTDGALVAVATGLLMEEAELLALFGAGTLPAYRGRGIQTALFGARINAAKEKGCKLAVTVTRGGTTSQRNAERLGFRVAYSKATMIRARE
ncbi:MAG: GNAT family N-acetyltransferase [Acidobacteria bacterium]|nr:GNAT family N-acetyltransferase [Acidobacteriota bacterium]